jgi:dTDP-4-amino-4,6-dideoxygalactose transaminase
MPFRAQDEVQALQASLEGDLVGGGEFTKLCEAFLKQLFHDHSDVLLVPSCTAALEMSALLLDIAPGDEVIMPSFTFVSTASAFALRGASIKFVDIEPESLNISVEQVRRNVSASTKAILPVHYAGNACDMSSLVEIGRASGATVIEDAAQGIFARYNGVSLGGIGDLGCISFHGTKNIGCGEGGALIVNDQRLSERAHFIREKGTNRRAFLNGAVDKYGWVELGSSFLLGELNAAVLYQRLQSGEAACRTRLEICRSYFERLAALDLSGKISLPDISTYAEGNGHIFYFTLNDDFNRDDFLTYMLRQGVVCTSHYEPLHTSPFFKRYSDTRPFLPVTERLAGRLVRLPVWPGITRHLDYIVDCVYKFFVRI